ncbi:CBS domain-containing protein [Marinibacterium profundimaris]|uniref:Histidine kinase n=1 Tax=Marinibacterium profundimaris TaxID=1679460 RepID=A0A225NKV4_9RHOB|nr:CBS domain-containing protein [Marinibacterium profundimaris]OWU74707.1 histidine kinase [Marinibacterium profundimaris]
MLVHQIIKSKPEAGVVTVGPDTSIADVAKILADKRIGTVVVSEDGKVALGILSERDIVRELAQSGSSCLSRLVSDYMTRDVVTCNSRSAVSEVLSKMTEGRFRHMPVVEDDAMIGLISLGDVVKAQLQALEMEKDALEGMIMGH